MIDLYEMIVSELYNKSISALLFLLDGGRELSFKYENIEYAITWKDKRIYLDNENRKDIQDFKNAWGFIENAHIKGKTFLEVWENIELLILF